MIKLGKELGEDKEVAKWMEVLERAKISYLDKLWHEEGQFFKFDTSDYGQKTIIADQLCGHWYLKMSGLEEYLPKDKVDSCLDVVYKNNVQGFAGGKLGAVNGAKYSGGGGQGDDVVDTLCPQSSEMWTGVTYGLASLFIAEGKIEQGFKTAEGVYESVYNGFGQGFETPEAVYEKGVYRSIGYMRPCSIWAMYEAWNRFHKK